VEKGLSRQALEPTTAREMIDLTTPLDHPDLGIVRLFSAYHWGYVRLWRFDDEGEFERIEANGYREYFPMRSLEQIHTWPQGEQLRLFEQIEVDAFASIHTLYGRPQRLTAASFTRLNAAWVDMDHGHNGASMSGDEAVAAVDQLESDGVLLPVSVFEHTGRGLRAYWMLGETEAEWDGRFRKYQTVQDHGGIFPDEPYVEQLLDRSRWRPRAHGNEALLQRINKALVSRVGAACPELNPDFAMTATTSSQRIHGSVNSRSGQRVSYVIRLPEGMSEPATYTLGELCEFCGLELPNTQTTQTARSYERKDQAMVKRNRMRFLPLWSELQEIRQHRGGAFKEGVRNRACLYAAWILHGCGWSGEAIRDEVYDLALRGCDPPLTESDARYAYQRGRQADHYTSNRTLALQLGVTAAEVAELGLKSIDPDYKYRPSTGATTARRKWRRARLQVIAGAEGNPIPRSLPALAEELGADPQTIRRDLKAVGLETAGQASS